MKTKDFHIVQITNDANETTGDFQVTPLEHGDNRDIVQILADRLKNRLKTESVTRLNMGELDGLYRQMMDEYSKKHPGFRRDQQAFKLPRR